MANNADPDPRLAVAVDYEAELDQMLNVTQLVTDLESGQFSAERSQSQLSIPDTPEEPKPYESPPWLVSFVDYMLRRERYASPEQTARTQTMSLQTQVPSHPNVEPVSIKHLHQTLCLTDQQVVAAHMGLSSRVSGLPLLC